MFAVLLHKPEHALQLRFGYLLKHSLIPLLKFLVKFLVNTEYNVPFLGQSEIDFFLVLRLLVDFDQFFSISFFVNLLMAPLVIYSDSASFVTLGSIFFPIYSMQ